MGHVGAPPDFVCVYSTRVEAFANDLVANASSYRLLLVRDPVTGKDTDLAKAVFVDDITQMHMQDPVQEVRTSPIDRILSRRAARTCKSLSRELGTGGFALNPSKTKSALSF